jgi:hypothetical protein
MLRTPRRAARLFRRWDAARTVFRIGDDRPHSPLLGVSALLEITHRPAIRVHAHAKRLGVGADVYRNAEGLRSGGGVVDRVVHPAIPCAVHIHQYELRVVEANSNDDRLGSLSGRSHERVGPVRPTCRRPLRTVLERPRPAPARFLIRRPQMTRPPSTQRIWPVM